MSRQSRAARRRTRHAGVAQRVGGSLFLTAEFLNFPISEFFSFFIFKASPSPNVPRHAGAAQRIGGSIFKVSPFPCHNRHHRLTASPAENFELPEQSLHCNKP